jgi:hypothetical protein
VLKLIVLLLSNINSCWKTNNNNNSTTPLSIYNHELYQDNETSAISADISSSFNAVGDDLAIGGGGIDEPTAGEAT